MGMSPASRPLLHAVAHSDVGTARHATMPGEFTSIGADEDHHPQLHRNFAFHNRLSTHVDLGEGGFPSQIELPRFNGVIGRSSLERVVPRKRSLGEGVRAPPLA